MSYIDDIRFGKTRGSPEHYFRVQVTWDGGQSFSDALVMKRDDREGPDRDDRPYLVEWAATDELEREAEAALGSLEMRFSAKHTRRELKKFLKGLPRHYVPTDAEVPADLGVRIANARVGLGVHAGTEPEAWEQEADAAALQKAATKSSGGAGDVPGKDRLVGLVRSRYPGWLGFWDPRFDGGRYDEVKYKLTTAAKAKELLSKQALRSLIDAGDHGEMIERLKTVGRDTNLLFRPYSPGGDLDLLYQEGLDHRVFCEAFLSLLHGDGDVPQRLDRYSDQVRSMGLPPNVNRWAMPTYFLFFLFPVEEVLIKPRTVRWLLDLGGWGGRLGVEPSGDEYAQVHIAYSELREALEEHKPRHMIDVQGFAWVAEQEANERAKAAKRAREPGHEQVPRINQAMAEFEREADAHDLIERQELLDRTHGRFKKTFGTVAKIESLSPSEFFGFFNELDTHGGRTPGLFSPNLPFPTSSDKHSFRDFEEDLPVFRKALGVLLHGDGTDAKRLDDMWTIGSGVRRYITESLPIPSALLFLQDPAKWSGILQMNQKEEKLAMAGVAPALAADASLGERFVALERALIALPPKYGRKYWGPEVVAPFYFSRAFKRNVRDGKDRDAIYTIEDARQDLFIPRDHFIRLLDSIKSRKNLILQGPPGTGKTFIARRIAWCLIGRKDSDPIEMVQFHQSYAYEDFVQGYRPNERGGFDLKDGVFHRFCERARANPDIPHVFIIDEINRGNLSRIFGELLMLIERDKRSNEYAVVLTYSDQRFHVPGNVFILGMMNTADRSLALVDYALRRRFAFETLEPAFGTDYGRTAFENYVSARGAGRELVACISARIRKLNEAIKNDKELGPGFQIGHSYFVPEDGDEPSEDWYKHVVDTQIAPLLREYWFDSPEDVEKELAKLRVGAGS